MFLRVNGTLCKCRISLYFVFADKKTPSPVRCHRKVMMAKLGMGQNELYIRMVNKVRVS